MLKGNKGEWSEVYTLLKIVSDKQLIAGDSELNKIEKLFFPVIEVLRDESEGTFVFGYKDDLVIVTGVGSELRIPILEFQKQASILLSGIKLSSSSSFSIPEVEEFWSKLNCKTLKAKSSIKSDIRIVIHDQRTGRTPELGFSIKSQLGSASTLLNAGKTTNFIFRIAGLDFSEKKLHEINSIDGRSKVKDRIKEIQSSNGKFVFDSVANSVFEDNLSLIDSALPKIISELVLLFYTSNNSKILDLTKEIHHKNPISFNLDNKHPFYHYKIKKFLTDISLGMMPSKVWTGKMDATGGFLVVKDNGDILCYHIYNRNEFEDYLIKSTKLETASTNKHDFGKIYIKDNKLFFNLNLQIRFLK